MNSLSVASRYIACALAVGALSAAARAETHTVTVTNGADAGPGSLRAAIAAAKASPIPMYVDFDPAVQYIELESPLRVDAPGAIHIDGAGNVTLAGAPGSKGAGLVVISPGTTVTGLVLQAHSGDGIYVQSTADNLTVDDCVIVSNGGDGIFLDGELGDDLSNVTIRGCTIGVMPDGAPAPNGSDAIDAEWLINSAIGVPGNGNVLAAGSETFSVAAIRLSEPADVVIEDNFVGTDPTGMVAIADESGIIIRNASNVIVRGNLVAGWTTDSMRVFINDDIERTGPTIQNNIFGQAADGSPLPNHNGIRLVGLTDTLVGGSNSGDGNLIAHCTGIAIQLLDSQRITMRRNLVFDNAEDDIVIEPGSNGDIARPQITSADPLVGVAPPNSLVDIYTGDSGAEAFVETVSADAAGNFAATAFKGFSEVRVQATDPLGNSSELSQPAQVDADDDDVGCASNTLGGSGANRGDAWLLVALGAALMLCKTRRVRQHMRDEDLKESS